ncbi:MAG: transposase domain-containing protein [Terracidiphilus sp.]
MACALLPSVWSEDEVRGKPAEVRCSIRQARAKPLLDDLRNWMEWVLRAVAIGRKNYLFMGPDSGGQRAASFYSLIGTAKLSGLDPAFCLRLVLATIAEQPINRIAELLPW